VNEKLRKNWLAKHSEAFRPVGVYVQNHLQLL